jgi:hypothetical protein
MQGRGIPPSAVDDAIEHGDVVGAFERRDHPLRAAQQRQRRCEPGWAGCNGRLRPLPLEVAISQVAERTASLMRERIAELEAGRIGVSRLVGDLEALIASLDGEVASERVDELQSAWWPLELGNATAIDHGRAELSLSQRQEVEDACRELRRLLDA